MLRKNLKKSEEMPLNIIFTGKEKEQKAHEQMCCGSHSTLYFRVAVCSCAVLRTRMRKSPGAFPQLLPAEVTDLGTVKIQNISDPTRTVHTAFL